MPKKVAAQMIATLRLWRICGVILGVGCGIAPEPDQGDDEDQDDEQDEAERQRDVAAAAGLPFGRRLALGIAHRNSSPRRTRGFTPIRCSTSRVAKISVR